MLSTARKTMPPRVLLAATTTGYQTRAFRQAAERLGVHLALATDRCRTLEDPWRDAAIPVRFHDEAGSVRAIVREAARHPFRGVLAVGDRPVTLAARAAGALDLPWHPLAAARACRSKLETRRRLRMAGLPVPWYRTLAPEDHGVRGRLEFPCVVKPLSLSGSRGVIRADSAADLDAAVTRVRQLLQSRDVRGLREPNADTLLVEGYIPGEEYAIEGLLEHGQLRVLAVFDKPDPLVGPFFEETIYVTPSRASAARRAAMAASVADAIRALGLTHGPVHAECRVDGDRVFVLEVAARPIGGLCARALRFCNDEGCGGGAADFEELLLRHALGESTGGWSREPLASGVMMIPIPRRGIYRRTDNLDSAAAVEGITAIEITARPDQHIVPLPEGASYLGFIFARAAVPAEVEGALREAHGRLRFVIDRPLHLVPAGEPPLRGAQPGAAREPRHSAPLR
jgi:hypothetical protein